MTSPSKIQKLSEITQPKGCGYKTFLPLPADKINSPHCDSDCKAIACL